MDFFKRCWVEIDLDKIEHNYKIIREFIGDKKMISVVKADAYGHGVEFVAQKLDSLGTYIREVINAQLGMFSYHSTPGMGMDHPFYSPWYEWPLMQRPMYY
ncbi:MAG: alanine racemase, partial [Clostridia bacterium]|nr:alanine racemase [Clostridia bacterium]